jgi:DNA mismatch repair protein MutS
LGAGDTLFDVIDKSASALGRRCLTRWLRRPLVERRAIETRLDAVDALVEASVERTELQDGLANAYDLERLVGRVSRGRAHARDLRSLQATLSVVPDLIETLDGIDALAPYRERLDPLEAVADLIDSAIVDEPPTELTEGGVIKPSFDAELDELRTTEREGRQWVAELEAAERERTGIDSLSVGHNQVHGYYIEVTNPNLDRVPDDYTRRQTLKNSERFYTPELKERENEIFGAAERADSLEYELFCEVRREVAAETERIQALATALAELDAICSLATVAAEGDYIRPQFHDGSADSGGINIEGGRHPVVETTQDSFVPNDADLSQGEVAIITGPNMSGKSTYMRQVALTCLLAQIGSFVPAEAAGLPVLDRIFTRVGASDDIAGGQSTFMREMSELTEILHDASEDSLVLLDEVGRGTSTADGLAIAQATTEFIHDELGATTLFATHYHGLTELADEREGVVNRHFAATREGDEVTFLHRVAPGASSASYGIEVARMAGVPETVVDRARSVVESADGSQAERGPTGSQPTANVDQTPTDKPADSRSETNRDGSGTTTDTSSEQTSAVDNDRSSYPEEEIDVGAEAADDRASYPEEEFFGGTVDPAVDDPLDEESMVRVAVALRSVDVASMTPLEALNTLDELRSELRE